MKRRNYLYLIGSASLSGCLRFEGDEKTTRAGTQSDPKSRTKSPSGSTDVPEISSTYSPYPEQKTGNSRESYATPENWTQFQANPVNTGYRPNVEPPPRNASNRWSTQLTDEPIQASPVIADGLIFLGAWDGNLYAVNIESGDVEWKVSFENKIDSTAVVVDQAVIVGDEDGIIRALSLSDGEKQWETETSGTIYGLTHTDGTIFASSGRKLLAYSATDGSLVWRRELKEHQRVTPAINESLVFTAGYNVKPMISAIKVKTGDIKWQYQVEEYIRSSPSVAGEMVFVGSEDNNLYAINATDGTEEWIAGTGGDIATSPAVTEDVVVVGSIDQAVYAFDRGSGEKRWRFVTGEIVLSSPVIIDDTVYVGSSDGHIYGLSLETGKGLWKKQIGTTVTSPVALDKTLYVVAESTIHAIS